MEVGTIHNMEIYRDDPMGTITIHTDNKVVNKDMIYLAEEIQKYMGDKGSAKITASGDGTFALTIRPASPNNLELCYHVEKLIREKLVPKPVEGEDKNPTGAFLDGSSILYCTIPIDTEDKFRAWASSHEEIVSVGTAVKKNDGTILIGLSTKEGKGKYIQLAASSYIRTLGGKHR